jgi:catechol-2,3-dioxygenase
MMHIAGAAIYVKDLARTLRFYQEVLGPDLFEKTWSGEYAWLRARSLFFDDPEGNTIELIAHTPGG